MEGNIKIKYKKMSRCTTTRRWRINRREWRRRRRKDNDQIVLDVTVYS